MKTRTQKRKMKKSNIGKTFKNKYVNSLKTVSSKNKSLKKVNCSPKAKGEINQYSCYTNKSLYKLRDL